MKDINEINWEYYEWIMKILNKLINIINDYFTQILSMNYKIDILICQIAKYFNQIMKYFTQFSLIISRINLLI